jgi:hypothetical protein
VLVGLLILGGIVARFADDGDPPPAPTAQLAQEAARDATYRWASLAEQTCSVQRTHAHLRLEDVERDRGNLDFAETWAVLRPFEQELIAGLRTLPRIDQGEHAVGLLARDLKRLDRIADDYAAGRSKAAAARFRRLQRDESTEQAFAALGVHECALSSTVAR